MSSLARKVLQSFKKLHRTRMKVFQGDTVALNAARLKINEEYKKNKQISDELAIKTMIQFGDDVEKELRTQVIQARTVKHGVFEVKITPDLVKLDNLPYNDNAVSDDGIPSKTSCCQSKAQDKT